MQVRIHWSQVKRIHEYKRQLLNVMSIIHRYSEIKAMSPEERKQVSRISKTLLPFIMFCTHTCMHPGQQAVRRGCMPW